MISESCSSLKFGLDFASKQHKTNPTCNEGAAISRPFLSFDAADPATSSAARPSQMTGTARRYTGGWAALGSTS